MTRLAWILLLLLSACGSIGQGIEADLGRRLSATRHSVSKLAAVDKYPDAPRMRRYADAEINRVGHIGAKTLTDEPHRLSHLAPGKLADKSGDLGSVTPTTERLLGEKGRLESAWTHTLEFLVRQQRFGN